MHSPCLRHHLRTHRKAASCLPLIVSGSSGRGLPGKRAWMRPQAGGDPAISNHGPAASQGSPPSGLQSRHRKRYKPSRSKRPASGCSSGVEHNLAKVGVEGSNPFARSNTSNQNERRQRAAAIVWPLLAVRTRGIRSRLELRLAPDFPSGGGLPRGWVVAVGTPLRATCPPA